ncbi:CRAL/TRIO domain-containing protein [Ditylenchus destructor]|uniref:CRAL/TRIO domain-containing protein n=1 Tax=Ditylenchus destructor TaxID=166010 RepID=A0AAD4N5L5_9BILA|nr:CRAL/TRIO domain-containing protein [Ditylenchus destructor]
MPHSNIKPDSDKLDATSSEVWNRNLSTLEREQIRDLRTIVPKLANVDDAYVLRWLRSKDGRFDECADVLKKNMIFRKAWDLDRIERWTAPEILEKYCGYGFLSDREGNPILMSLLGNMDVEGMLRSVQSKDYIKFSLAAIEKGVKLCNDRAEQTGRTFEQMMLVFDLDHISSAHYSSKQFASSFTTLVLLFQEHYPLVLRKILIIRAPEMARIAFNSMTPFLSSSIQSLIEMPSEEGWQSALSHYVDLNAWPMHWGGRLCDDNGDPKCPSLVRYGLGPVPDTYYVDPDNAMPDYDQLTTVYAGDKHLIELKVKANTRISWQYMTEEEDVGFAIYYDKTNMANNLTEMENVYPYIRLECSQVPVSGSLVCEQSGRYMIEFDNYYSWFSAKQLRYNIEIDELCDGNMTPNSSKSIKFDSCRTHGQSPTEAAH